MGLRAPAARSDEFASLVHALAPERLARLAQEEAVSPIGLRERMERRVVELLCTSISSAERRASLRLPTNLRALVQLDTRAAVGRVTNLGTGGAFVDVALEATVGDAVVVALDGGGGLAERSVEIIGQVAWLAASDGRSRSGFGVRFQMTTAVEERHLRGVIMDILEKQIFPR